MESNFRQKDFVSTAPKLAAPAGDCHMHIYDPRFRAAPSWPMPLPDAPVAAYRLVQRQLGLARAVIVQPNGYRFDNACTAESSALAHALAAGQPDRCA